MISNLGSTGDNNNQTNPTRVIEHLFGYTGRMFDNEIGLRNNLNRWYDGVVGRWISKDPIGFEAGDANLYRYVGNRSTIATDPSRLLVLGGNRKISSDKPRSPGNPLSHGYIVVYHKDENGDYCSFTTYGWAKGWQKDDPKDRKAVDEASESGKSFRPVGEDELDPYIDKAYLLLKQQPQKPWFPGIHDCKDERENLIKLAKYLQRQNRMHQSEQSNR